MRSISCLKNTAVTAPGSTPVTDIPMTEAVLPARTTGLRRFGSLISAACLSIPITACGTIQRSPSSDTAMVAPVVPVAPANKRVWQESGEAQVVAARERASASARGALRRAAAATGARLFQSRHAAYASSSPPALDPTSLSLRRAATAQRMRRKRTRL
jgi:hypothetical protein